jgi:alpha-L-rhamnosidase
MFGGGLVWYYRKLAGMNTDPAEPGYRHIIFRPQPVDGITFTKYFNNTSYGNAGIHWEKEGDEFSMDITVPVGCRATVYVPAKPGQRILDSEKEIEKSEYVRLLGDEEGYRIFEVKSGKYAFRVL